MVASESRRRLSVFGARDVWETDVVWHLALRATGHESAASWLATRLSREAGTVSRSVPDGFAAYARIFHPSEHDQRRCSWWAVAPATGRRVHALTQWHALVGSPDSLNATGSLWPGGNPRRGCLEPDLLAALCGLLAGHTSQPEQCFFCLWEGYGWDSAGTPVFGVAPRAGVDVDDVLAQLASRGLAEEERAAARVELPGRTYLLFEGSLAALARSLSERLDAADSSSPSLFTTSRRICLAGGPSPGAWRAKSTLTRRSSPAAPS